MIRRSLSSSLPFHSDRTIGSDIPPSQTKLVETPFAEHEADAYMAYQKRNRKNIFIRDETDPRRFHWNMAKLRKLILATSWMGMIMLDGTLKNDRISAALRDVEQGVLARKWLDALSEQEAVDLVASFYSKGIGANNLHRTAVLENLLRGSPKARAMLPILRDQVCIHGEKAIIWTLFPAEQVYIACILKEANISCAVVHGGMNQLERTSAIQNFTRKPSPSVLVMSYQINSAGLNLHYQCRNVHLYSVATSKATLDQAIARVWRVGQTKIVMVYEYRATDTFDDYLIRRNTSKIIPAIIVGMSKDLLSAEMLEEDASNEAGLDLNRSVLRDGEIVKLGDDEQPQGNDVTRAGEIAAYLANSLTSTSL